MAERYTGTIDILKSDIERYPTLKKAIEDEFFWNGKLEDIDNWDEESPIAHYKDTEATYGHFETVETLCQELHVPYDQWSQTYSEDAMTRYYRPDVNNGNEMYADGDGEFIYTETRLRNIIKELDDKKNENDYLELAGKAFLEFLSKIPNIRPLTEYEGYIHNKKE